ncbi:unnamed protein product [Trichogramma brassicae]|uniref:Uncharacterized protein n=1 Tax=Trichogramma brassicae TaxID=86971 RepID=A0A6H5JAF1_9HYME|nr:unnamed protein product [Trichogramma brassicae]
MILPSAKDRLYIMCVESNVFKDRSSDNRLIFKRTSSIKCEIHKALGTSDIASYKYRRYIEKIPRANAVSASPRTPSYMRGPTGRIRRNSWIPIDSYVKIYLQLIKGWPSCTAASKRTHTQSRRAVSLSAIHDQTTALCGTGHTLISRHRFRNHETLLNSSDRMRSSEARGSCILSSRSVPSSAR